MISIIIPTFNRGHLLAETIFSIQKQSYKYWELLIIDDHSTDNTSIIVQSIAETDYRIFYFLRPHYLPKGANSCRNYGFEKSSGEFIKWVDSDDILRNDCFDLQNTILRNNPEVIMCLGYSQFFNTNVYSRRIFWSKYNESNNIFYDHIVNKIRWGIGGILWRKNGLDEYPFYPYLKNSQEWFMHSMSLLKLKDYQIYNCKEIVYYVRVGHLRMSSSKSYQYFCNQGKARIMLIKSMIFHRRFIFSEYFELSKQIIVYYFHAVKSFIKFY